MLFHQIWQSIAVSLALPGVLMSLLGQPVQTKPEADTAVTETVTESLYIPVVMPDGRVRAMELEQYVYRVVLGEMPLNFEVEALKAQAVATRTYTMRRVERGDKHNGAVCTDYTCCQAYREPEDYLAQGGTQAKLDKLSDAVAETCGQVLRYNGELITATYFASAGGSTEDACQVWGSEIPYLVSVPSPDDGLEKTRTFSAEEFQAKLGVCLEGNPTKWFGEVSYTTGGGVETMKIGEKTYSGVKLRSMLGLRSTVFTVTATETAVTVSTQGYGHRVGMSQYGADAMAVSGSTYEQILSHYYQGTTLTKL